MNDNLYDLMIAGTGPAGLTAAIFAQRLGMKTVVFGNVPGGNLYMIDKVMNFPGFIGGVPGTQLGVTMFSQAQEEGAFFPMTRLQELNFSDGRFIGLDSNSACYASDAALIACGVIPKVLDARNADKKGIYYCALCDGPLFYNTDADLAVIGGGNMAGQEALILSRFAKKVWIIYRGNQLKAEAAMRRTIDKTKNIEVLLNTNVIAYTGNDRIKGLILSTSENDKYEIHVDGVFMAIGWRPDISMLKIPVEKTPEGYIKTNSKLMSSFPGLFAAGDVRDTDIRQVITACADGARASTYALEFIQQA